MTDTAPNPTPKSVGDITLYPATFGLITWLSDVRKNPAVHGEEFGLQEVAELCYAFTVPSAEVDKLTPKQLKDKVHAFMHSMTPELFTKIQKHAEKELLKYFDSMTAPKKKAVRKPSKQ